VLDRCCDGGHTLATVNPDGSNETLVGGPNPGSQPAWSPDGTQLAQVFNSTGRMGVWASNLDGTNLRQIANWSAFVAYPDWSPNGSSGVAFQGDTHGLEWWLVFPGVGSGSSVLSHDTGPVSFSPDGSKIAYHFYFFDGETGAEVSYIDTIDVNTRARVRLTTDAAIDHSPAWSPDGRQIAFVSTRDDPNPTSCWYCKSAIYVMNADGSDQHRITPVSDASTGAQGLPDWQPIVNRPPECSHVTATPGTLWPPNHKLVPVGLSGATDPDGDHVTLTITGVTQDEPTGNSPNAVLGPASNEVSLRAERDGAGDGRVYRIAFKATDGRGGECSGTATVGVPHNRGSVAVDSAPPSYDSLVH
jgi:WD40-like Beta Propeller Repeat